ncbi:MAG: preprotein translocase subunit SecG, partial [Candidatus Dadabacteria bacterium]|nr:preprotein translocase subunit SecG [Candidatus Dadabacteria bacterium]
SVKIIHIVISLLLVLIILLQPSKSGDIGSMFGGGSSESLFGSSGAMPFLVKMTRLLGLVFVITSLFLGYSSVKSITGSVVEKSPSEAFEELSDPDKESLGDDPAQSTNAQRIEQSQQNGTDLDKSVPAQVSPEIINPEKIPEE